MPQKPRAVVACGSVRNPRCRQAPSVAALSCDTRSQPMGSLAGAYMHIYGMNEAEKRAWRQGNQDPGSSWTPQITITVSSAPTGLVDLIFVYFLIFTTYTTLICTALQSGNIFSESWATDSPQRVRPPLRLIFSFLFSLGFRRVHESIGQIFSSNPAEPSGSAGNSHVRCSLLNSSSRGGGVPKVLNMVDRSAVAIDALDVLVFNLPCLPQYRVSCPCLLLAQLED